VSSRCDAEQYCVSLLVISRAALKRGAEKQQIVCILNTNVVTAPPRDMSQVTGGGGAQPKTDKQTRHILQMIPSGRLVLRNSRGCNWYM
jgi:hypothetical protein